MRTRLFTLFCLLPLALTAQSAKPDYSGESFVIERSDYRDTFAADGTGTREHTFAIHIQSEAALRDLSVLAIPFASASEKVEILYARSRHPDGTVTETPTADALEQPEPVTTQAPFYSDLKQKQLPIKSLRVGDTFEWQARITRFKPEAPNQFWGQEGFVNGGICLEETVELRVPKASHLTLYTNPKLHLVPTESDEGTEHIYRWQHASLDPTAGPAAEAAKALKKKTLLTPEEELELREGQFPSVAWTTFPSWAAVGDWYRSLESGRTAPDAEIKAKVAELIATPAGKPPLTEEERVRAIYGFVAPQIRYIGVAFGVGRYQPHHAEEILQNQYGDCKDKHTLLAAMLTVLGLHPEAVLIGQGIRFNPAVPSPASFNHLITRVEVDGKPIWLDATAEVAPYRVLAYDLRDKQSLVVPDTAPATVQRTPKDLPFPAIQKMTAVGTLDRDGVSQSRITYSTRGDEELIFRQLLRQVPPQNYPELIQRISESTGYGGQATNPAFSRPEETRLPLTWTYDYKREQGGDWEHHKIIPQLRYNSLPLLDEKDPPLQSIELGSPRTEISTAELTIPAGWKAQLPEAVHAKSDFATLDLTYRYEKGVVYAELCVVVIKERLPASDWKTYRKWTVAAGLTEQAYVQLELPIGSRGSMVNPDEHSSAPNPDAQELLQKAFTALQHKDIATAAPFLEQVKKLSPEQPGLWGALGSIACEKKNFPACVLDFHKELELHPTLLQVYPALVQAQLASRDRPAAEQTLRDWSAANPIDPEPATRLIDMLLADNHPAQALSFASQAAKELPEKASYSPTFQNALGKAQLAAGAKPEGTKTLVALLKTSEDPLTLNDAAYELADTSLELPLAETASRKAVDQLTAETAAWTGDEDPKLLRSKSSLLIASWDTLGWILFRANKLVEAQNFVEASWLQAQHAEVGEHLGQIQAARGLHTEALATYRLTLRTGPAPAATERLESAVTAETKAGGKPADLPQDADLRTLNLGAPNGRKGSGEYAVLISAKHIEAAHPTGIHTVENALPLMQQATLPHLIPTASNAKIARQGILNCEDNRCVLILEPNL